MRVVKVAGKHEGSEMKREKFTRLLGLMERRGVRRESIGR